MQIYGEQVEPFTITNPDAYQPGRFGQVVRLEVEVYLDPVAGSWHQPQDIMNSIAKNSYVQNVKLVGVVGAERENLSDTAATVAREIFG